MREKRRAAPVSVYHPERHWAPQRGLVTFSARRPDCRAATSRPACSGDVTASDKLTGTGEFPARGRAAGGAIYFFRQGSTA